MAQTTHIQRLARGVCPSHTHTYRQRSTAPRPAECAPPLSPLSAALSHTTAFSYHCPLAHSPLHSPGPGAQLVHPSLPSPLPCCAARRGPLHSPGPGTQGARKEEPQAAAGQRQGCRAQGQQPPHHTQVGCHAALGGRPGRQAQEEGAQVRGVYGIAGEGGLHFLVRLPADSQHNCTANTAVCGVCCTVVLAICSGLPEQVPQLSCPSL